MNKKRVVLTFLVVFIILAVAVFLLSNSKSSGTGSVLSDSQAVEIVPLSQAQVQGFAQAVNVNEMIKDIPEKSPVAVTFYSFDNDGNRVFHESFLLGSSGFLQEGEPEVYLSMNAKYLDKINENNFCQVLQEANKAGDIGFYSETSNALLLIKYAGMLKHKNCLGL